MNKTIVILTTFLFLVSAGPVLAQYVAPTAPYTAPQVPATQLLINKMLQNPQTNQFVDNLSVDQFQFLPGQEVNFRITVKNTSTNTLTNIKVTDTLPAQLTFVSGPLTFDKQSNNFTFMIDKLEAGQSKDIDFKAKVVSAEQLPANVFCMSNLAQAQAGSMVTQDTASLCATKNILGVSKNLPQTGPNSSGILLGSVALLLCSLLLIKKSYSLKGGE